MIGPWNSRQYVYEGDKQIEPYSFAYNVILFIANYSKVEEQLSDQKLHPLINQRTENALAKIEVNCK